MEPRPFRRGDRRPRIRVAGRLSGFNGATPFQAWRRLRSTPAPRRTRSFNGATPFQAWRPRPRFPRTIVIPGFNGATPFQAWRPGRRGPRNRSTRRFNGATPFQAWRQPEWQARSQPHRPLQWSHALSGVETAGLSARRGTGVNFERPPLGTPRVESHEPALRSLRRPCPAENRGPPPPSSAYGMRCHHLGSRKPSVLKGFPSHRTIRRSWPSARESPPFVPRT